MQEIAQNIGIKSGKERVSITDKLSAKMDTSLPNDDTEIPEPEHMDVDENESMAQDPLQIPEVPSRTDKTVDTTSDDREIKKDPDEADMTDKDKSSAKIKDPLALVDTKS